MDQNTTPFADAVLRLRRRRTDGDAVASFHALPWTQGKCLRHPPSMWAKYEAIFGNEFLESDVTYSGSALDSYFRPAGALELAQDLAAEAFGATRTFFVTCGTTVANQVAVDAVTHGHTRILVDRSAHQSLHAAVARAPGRVDYAPATSDLVLDAEGLIRMLAEAESAGDPYDAVVLSAASYDGVVYDLSRLLPACLSVARTRTFVIDEAWAAIRTFHSDLSATTASHVARQLRQAQPRLQMLITHSAHKSMNAARQGSYLHVLGDDQFADEVAAFLYARHTTSPSIPILASLDLARAHAQAEGQRLVDRAIRFASRLHRELRTNPDLTPYRVRESAWGRRKSPYLLADPLKVDIDVTGLGMDGHEVRASLFEHYGIYVARTTPSSVLFNIHIGVTNADVDRLISALASLARRAGRRRSRASNVVGELVDGLVIAYPPGVPIAVPGESWSTELQDAVDGYRDHDIDVFTLPVSVAPAQGVAP